MSASPSLKDRRGSSVRQIREPVMKVNRYDRLSAGMIALVLGLCVGVFAVFMWWLTTRPPQQEFLVPLEMVASPGGVESGSIDETLQIESPEDLSDDASLTDDAEQAEISELLQNVVELAEQATQQVDQAVGAMNASSGEPGSANGTGGRPLGSGDGEGGIPAEQRWFIRYGDDASLEEYARQLDFFGLELGALLPDGQLVYLSKLSQPVPAKRVSTSGKQENRLYMTWQGGGRKEADVKLFAKAGVDVSRAVLFHFYPRNTEQLLATKEFQYARRRAQEIRRTYFAVVKNGNGFEFVVNRQTYLK